MRADELGHWDGSNAFDLRVAAVLSAVLIGVAALAAVLARWVASWFTG